MGITRKSRILVASFLLLLITVEAAIAEADHHDQGKEKKKPPPHDAASTHYRMLSPLPSGQERVFCEARGSCYYKTLVCPSECPQRKPKKNRKHKGCFVDCSSKCEVTCKYRKANCNGYGALCYDPRFVGGDGVMFYFHGAKGANFAIVSDENLQINAHFIGTRPKGRTRDFTWVQALSVMFDTHTLILAANKVPTWNDAVESLSVRYDGEAITIPTNGEEAEWRAGEEEGSTGREVVVERTDERNSVRVRVSGLVEIDVSVRPIGKEENRVHNYQLPEGDAFAHLEMQFRFGKDVTDMVDGVLGKTYRPGYVSPVKRGVAMPIMGGEDRYRTPSLFSASCRDCRFRRPSGEGNGLPIL
ncbi:Root_cap domain-containing protein [Senna tora]|uniref:Root_cap domain-containing protein n=1 Tax=Senna tora TaxID=362788 RepID=A0A834WHC8_9FABA|nr:Root_cap domain-containing protein [Senna tora]